MLRSQTSSRGIFGNFLSGSPKFQSIWNSITFNLGNALSDHYVWNGYSFRRFSINSAWDVLKDYRPTDSMHHLLWFSGFILRHSFIMWLISMGRLNTMNKQHVFQIIPSLTCILCGSRVETHEYLFFQWPFFVIVWGAITSMTLMGWLSSTWCQLLQ
jgi:hypothetical protein